MSVSFRSGLKFRTQDMNIIYGAIDEMRPRAQAIAERRFTHAIALQAALLIDHARHGFAVCAEDESSDNSALSLAWMRAMNKVNLVQSESRRSPEFDMSCSVMIFPGSKGSAPLLGLIFTEQQDLEALISADTSLVEPYPYWNNTDRPCGVSQAEWQDRADAWEDALRPGDVYAERGLSITLVHEGFTHLPTADSVAQAIQAEPVTAERISLMSKLLASRDVPYDQTHHPLLGLWIQSNEFRQAEAEHRTVLESQIENYSESELLRPMRDW